MFLLKFVNSVMQCFAKIFCGVVETYNVEIVIAEDTLMLHSVANGELGR